MELESIIIPFLSFFVWFVKWNVLIHYHLIPDKLIISTRTRNEVIPPNIRDELMIHHLIYNGLIPQPNTPLYFIHGWVIEIFLSKEYQKCTYCDCSIVLVAAWGQALANLSPILLLQALPTSTYVLGSWPPHQSKYNSWLIAKLMLMQIREDRREMRAQLSCKQQAVHMLLYSEGPWCGWM